jgi:CheY-like chemotaxis protein
LQYHALANGHDGAGVRRIAIVEDDAEMASLFEDLLDGLGSIAHVRGITSLTALAESAPDVILLGLNCSGGLPPWQLVELIRQHRTLHSVPVVVTMLDVATAMRDGHLSAYREVHAVEMPCDVELLRGVIARIEPSELAAHNGGPRSLSAAARLPDVCPHGYPAASVESCRVCRTVGTELALASLRERMPHVER